MVGMSFNGDIKKTDIVDFSGLQADKGISGDTCPILTKTIAQDINLAFRSQIQPGSEIKRLEGGNRSGCDLTYDTYQSFVGSNNSSSISGATQATISSEYQTEPSSTELNSINMGWESTHTDLTTYVGSAYDASADTLNLNNAMANFGGYLNTHGTHGGNFSVLVVPSTVTLLRNGQPVTAIANTGEIGVYANVDPSLSGDHGVIITKSVLPGILIHEIGHLFGLDHSTHYMAPAPGAATSFNSADQNDLSTQAELLYSNGYVAEECLDSYNPLPITLKSFDGEYRANMKDIELTWVTGSETNTKNFEIYRSMDDGKHWESLGEVVADNNPSGGSYSLVDNTFPLDHSNNISYEIRSEDYDGKVQLGKKINVKIPGDNASENIPTLVDSNSEIELRKTYLGYDLYDPSSRIVKSKTFGENETHQNIETPAAPGLYFLSLKLRNGELRTIKISVF